jgi:hypothetical protein
MSKILDAIAATKTTEDLDKLIKWMKKNNINDGYQRTAFQKMKYLETLEDNNGTEESPATTN